MAHADRTNADAAPGSRPGRAHSERAWGLWTILVLLLLVALVPVLLVQAASYYRQYRERRAAELALDAGAARAVGESFEGYLRELRRDENAVSRAFTQPPIAPRAVWNHILAQTIAGEPVLASLSWVDPAGRILASSDPPRVGRSLARLPWFEHLQLQTPWLVTNASRPGTGRGVVLQATQVRDDAGPLRGVMVAEIRPEALTDRLALRPMGARVFSLVDTSGWLVYRYPPASVAARDRDLGARYADLAAALRTQEPQTGAGYDPIRHERHLFAMVPLPSIGWVVTVAHPEREVTRPIALGLAQDAALLTLVALLAFFLAAFVARRVAVPVERLSQLALAVGRGDLSRRAPAQGPREVRQLGSAFNRMAAELHLREQEHDRVLELERARVREARVLEAIQEHTDTLLAYFDRDLRFRQVNTAYCRFLGRPREEVVGRAYAEVSDSALVLELLTRVRDSGEMLEVHEFLRPATVSPPVGPTYWNAAIVPVLDEHQQVEGIVLSATDISPQLAAREQLLASERERAEAERVRAQVAEAVAAETNHRMKNNLALISGLLQMQLQLEPRESPTAHALQDAVARISALAAVHEQLYSDQPGRVDLQAMLQRVAETALHSLFEGDLTLACNCPHIYAPAKIASMLAVAANEMVTNAIKHGAPGADGGRRITVSFVVRDQQAVLSVWNSGHPVAEDFDVAAQSGMGLRLLQALAEAQLRGSVQLRPADGGTACEVAMEAEALDLSLPAAGHDWQI